MSKHFTVNPKTDIVLERLIDAPVRLVWEALTKPEHVKEWWMPKPWGRVARVEMDLRPGGNFRLDLSVGNGPDIPNMGCILEVVPEERFVFTSMLFADYRPAVFDDIPISAVITMKSEGARTRYVFTALHRDEGDMQKNKETGWLEGTEVAIDQFVTHVIAMR